MKRTLQLLNVGSVIFALVMNFLVSSQVLNAPSINEISERYSTVLTPATYAFSIWGVIYVLMIVFAVYQARDMFSQKQINTVAEKTGIYFVVANICNGLWTYMFVNGFIGISVLIILTMAISLFIVLQRLDIALDSVPIQTIVCVWWPIMVYVGWVIVASVVNIASWLASVGVQLSPFQSGVVLIALCGVLLWLLLTRNVRELVLSSVWGITAIGLELMGNHEGRQVMVTSFAVSLVLVTFVLVHAFQNRMKIGSSIG